ncbi:glucose/arabinose dehydrogenase [Algoriphagus sp. 4150]|uniref:PQQ-dependent sugar dehydrogenase n=1 Tax=Algoriphagus sp. 4150 TaxID=2817756 RepID=UPI0028577E1F|nr:PQQ-dependent sugar dehydrogenase [Algoriphagus sp. 4150]MDR7130223.1 glucose/arabinose dehydrogenase [Algoriphagus sp. 4150]
MYFKSLVIVGALSFLTLSACSPIQGKLHEIVPVEGKNRVDISESIAEVKLETIVLPENFKIEVWAADVPNARSLARSEEGIVFVGNRGGGSVFALIDSDADGRADYRYTLAEGMRQPNGIAYRNGDLYLSEVSRILKFPDIKNNLTNPYYEVVFDGFPTKGHHGHKYLGFGPDGKLYVPVGAPCNICNPEEEIFGTITRIDVDATEIKPEIVAHGVRNTVGFDWDPETGNLWFTDNNRDMMGDDIPSCELNEVTEPGQHFGYPFWHAGDVIDPEFGELGMDSDNYKYPIVKLGAHVAPLGMKFYRGAMFPKIYRKSIFIAEHGSWNRSKKVGYKISVVDPSAKNGQVGKSVFAEGWLDQNTQEVWGRPVDVMELPDGSLLVSDDFANCIYRIFYSPD